MQRVDIIINLHGSSFNDHALYIYRLLTVNTICDPLIWFKYDDWQEGKNEIYWKEDYEGYFDSPYQNIVAPRIKPIKERESLKYKDIHGDLEPSPVETTDKYLRLVNCTESKRTAGLILKNPKDRGTRICTTTPEMNISVEIRPLPFLLLLWGPKTLREGTKGPETVTAPACKLQLPENSWDPQGSKEPPSATFSMEKSEWEASTTCTRVPFDVKIKSTVIIQPGEPVSGA